MKTRMNDALIEAINTVYKDSKRQELTPENILKLKPNLKIIATYLKVTIDEAFVFSMVIVDSYLGDTASINDICRHLDVNSAAIIKYFESFIKLEEKGILISKSRRSNKSEILTGKEYMVHHEIANAILRHEICPKIQKRKIKNLIDAIGEIYLLMERLNDDEIAIHDYYQQVSDLMNDLKRFKFMNQLLLMDLKNSDISVLCYVIWKTLGGNNKVDIETLLKDLLLSPSRRINYQQDLKNSQNKLIKNDLLEIIPNRFLNDLELKPSNKLVGMLKENGINMVIENSKRSDIIEPTSIGEKALFYNSSESLQINSLRSMIEENNYTALIDRLKSKNLPLGVNILLYGAPGTGKTESVLQLAKASGREIVKVEISQTKSMWFGESEKIIKKVFTDYAEYSKTCAKTPILLFNEADAILGTRNEMNGNGAVKQTENTIQNILLEELENFHGIFFATTNLARNLDKAFERRFLFKIEFHKPSIEARTNIWMNKLPFISDHDALILAEQFDLSGGQIENIVRKSEIDFILQGQDVNLETLIRFCQEETLSNKSQRIQIGF